MTDRTREVAIAELTIDLVTLFKLCGYDEEGFAFHPDNDGGDYSNFTPSDVCDYEVALNNAHSLATETGLDIHEFALQVWSLLRSRL